MKTTFRIFTTLALVFCLCLTTFAADFTPSVEAKPAPEIVEYKFDGKPVAALFVDENGNVLDGVPAYGSGSDGETLELVIGSVADMKDSETAADAAPAEVLPEIAKAMENAIEQIAVATSVADLSEGLAEDMQDTLDEFFGDSDEKLNLDDLAISDVFDISAIIGNEVVHTFGGNKIKFRIKPKGIKRGDFNILIHNIEGNVWRVEKDVVWEDDETMAITTDCLSPFAFVVEKPADLSVDPDAPQSPQTGNAVNSNFLYVGISAVCILAAGYFFVKAAKKAKAE